MKYRQKLLELTADSDGSAIVQWIMQQPLLDQTEIMRELKQLAEEMDDGTGQVLDGISPEFDSLVDEYEDRILDEKLAYAQLQMVKEELGALSGKIENSLPKVRAYLIECIVTDAPNANLMREVAESLINFEKGSGTFDPENWEPIL